MLGANLPLGCEAGSVIFPKGSMWLYIVYTTGVQSVSHKITSEPEYIMHSYMNPLGLGILQLRWGMAINKKKSILLGSAALNPKPQSDTQGG